jgi:hypothetical protein
MMVTALLRLFPHRPNSAAGVRTSSVKVVLKRDIQGSLRCEENEKFAVWRLLPDSLANDEPAAFIDAPPPLNSLTLLRLFR